VFAGPRIYQAIPYWLAAPVLALCSVIVTLFIVLFWLLCSGCHVLASHVLAVMFWPSCSGCHVLAVMFWLSCSGCHVLAVMFWPSCSGRHVLAAMFWLFLLCLSCSACPLLIGEMLANKIFWGVNLLDKDDWTDKFEKYHIISLADYLAKLAD
jgi:hypothetical protein